MGAYAELDIYLKEGAAFTLNHLLSFLDKRGLNACITKILMFDDWEFTNQVTIEPAAFGNEDSDIFWNKFTIIDFTVNDKKCVLITSIDDGCLDLLFGVDTNDLYAPDEIEYEKFDAELFDLAADVINDCLLKEPLHNDFLIATMGVEYASDFQKDISMMVQQEYVPRSIVLKDFASERLRERFEVVEKSNCLFLRSQKRDRGCKKSL